MSIDNKPFTNKYPDVVNRDNVDDVIAVAMKKK